MMNWLLSRYIPNCAVFGLIMTVPATADTSQLPVHKLHINCDMARNAAGEVVGQELSHAPVAKALTDFAEFGRRHEGRAVYVEIAIEASNSAGSCEMFDAHLAEVLPEDVNLNAIDRWFGASLFEDESDNTKALRVWARTTETNAGHTDMILPDVSRISKGGLFITQRFAHFYFFSGPSVVHYTLANGFDGVVLYPVDGSHIFWREVADIRNALSK